MHKAKNSLPQDPKKRAFVIEKLAEEIPSPNKQQLLSPLSQPSD
jgi:hypothetical protein